MANELYSWQVNGTLKGGNMMDLSDPKVFVKFLKKILQILWFQTLTAACCSDLEKKRNSPRLRYN